MEFIPSVVEAQVGIVLSLPLAVASCIYTGSGQALKTEMNKVVVF